MHNGASFNEDSDSSSINFDFISETTPLNQNNPANYFAGNSNDDILSSSLLVEMKNLKNKRSPKSVPYHSKRLLANADAANVQHGDAIDATHASIGRKKALQLWQSTLNIDQLLIQVKIACISLDIRLLQGQGL